VSPPAPVATVPPAVVAPPDALSYPKFELGGTLVRDLPSSPLTGKTHRLIISIPGSFRSEPTRRYPVLFLLDAQWDFPVVNSTAGKLRYDKVFPEMLIVGLSYAGDSPNYDQLRSDDYVPTRAKSRSGVEQGGGGPHFLEWLEREAIPLVEKDYRADPERRVLAGTSHGGLFTLFALFEKPELFWGYIAVSPSAGWDSRYLFKREKEFRLTHPELPRRVWLSWSSEERKEYVADERAFFRQFTESRYKNLSLKVHPVEGGRHSSGAVEAYARGLRFIAEPLVEMPPK
jgi:predicted alpha/beta superfamily hydrolase